MVDREVKHFVSEQASGPRDILTTEELEGMLNLSPGDNGDNNPKSHVGISKTGWSVLSSKTLTWFNDWNLSINLFRLMYANSCIELLYRAVRGDRVVPKGDEMQT